MNSTRTKAFSLIELLTVIFIITLLIGILVPSIGAARTSAKKATTATTLNVIKTALETFKNDNERDFRRTNGYPPSFEHPPIPGHTAFNKEQRRNGGFPFLNDNEFPRVYGAQWLPAMLMGVDALGYVQRSSVTHKNDIHIKPWLWYDNEQLAGINADPLPRASLYLSSNTPTKLTRNIPGSEPEDAIFPDFDKIKNLPVIVDAFGQPILYYVANPNGKVTNMLADSRDPLNDYDGNVQEKGVPFYFHEDNAGYTGTSAAEGEEEKYGWDFGGRKRPHLLGNSGASYSPSQIYDDYIHENKALRQPFARYILDRNIWKTIEPTASSTPDSIPLKPVNSDSFLLISAGPDGIYGTRDDVSNLPPFSD